MAASPSLKSRTYQFGHSRLTVQFGDISTSQAEVLVSSDDRYLTMGGGVSAAIRGAGGNAIPWMRLNTCLQRLAR